MGDLGTGLGRMGIFTKPLGIDITSTIFKAVLAIALHYHYVIKARKRFIGAHQCNFLLEEDVAMITNGTRTIGADMSYPLGKLHHNLTLGGLSPR